MPLSLAGARTLVTGGAGFIGGAIAAALVEAGASVTVLDDLSAGRRERVPLRARFVAATVVDPTLGGIADEPWDLVVHCAAQISVARSMVDPALDRAVNLEGTANVLAAVAPSSPRFLFFSTGGAIYGERSSPATEDSPTTPASYYGVHKLAAEGYVALSGLSHAVLRPANVYGPGQRSDTEGGVVSIFLERLLRDEPLLVFGDGEQVRDLVYVGDVVAAVLALASNDVQGVFNVGTGVTTSVNELIAALGRATGHTPNTRYEGARRADLRYSCLDGSRLRQAVTGAARTSLDDGLGLLFRATDAAARRGAR